MFVKTFYCPIDVLSVLLQVKVTKLDNTCLVGLILSSIAIFVKNVIDSDHPLDCLKFTLIEQVSNKTEKDLD